ncbi:MAG: Ldh family oxidoreductase [Planctomycetes bacterium]|nr:Ldh family oxidoreductase [Planctomycetota bacterium]
MPEESLRYTRTELERFCREIFEKLQLSPEDSRVSAEVLTASDAYGIPSHGMGRLWRYVNALNERQVIHDAEDEIIKETPSTIMIDAHGGMGAPVSVRCMERVIAKAKATGCAFGCVRNSNHFGIAGYYANMALEHDMLGFAMSNTGALGVPTFGRQVMYGSNPLAFAAPANEEKAFLLDMSTTIVSRGKLEVYENAEEPLPEGWAVDKTGKSATDAHAILDDMLHRLGGGLLPLGGISEQGGGHKGYGLAIMVDILSGVLGGGTFGPDIYDTATVFARMCHFFGAIRIDYFRDPEEFRQDMDKMLRQLRTAEPAEGEERVYFAGLKEFEEEARRKANGIPVHLNIVKQVTDIAKELGVEALRAIAGS